MKTLKEFMIQEVNENIDNIDESFISSSISFLILIQKMT